MTGSRSFQVQYEPKKFIPEVSAGAVVKKRVDVE